MLKIMICHKYGSLHRREALHLWKRKKGSPTYYDLIGIFERAGKQEYIEAVKGVHYDLLHCELFSNTVFSCY